MEDPVIKEQTPEEVLLERENAAMDEDYECYKRFLIVIAIVILFCFFWGQHLDIKESINADMWGQYGDLIGGVLGTVVAFISIRYLITTLKEQRIANSQTAKANEEASKVNEISNDLTRKSIALSKLELFKSEFESILQLYKDSLSEYQITDNKGKDAFNSIINDLLNSEYSKNRSFKIRNEKAVRKFNVIYVDYRSFMSVHFRMLYQLFMLIHTSSIDEDRKVVYAKAIRAQFSEQELIAIYYNCHNQYGMKMQIYVNRYNLLKHLPYTRLIEFRKWKEKFGEDPKILNQLDVEIITLKKILKQLVDCEDLKDATSSYDFSERYKMDVSLTERWHKFDLTFIRVDREPNQRKSPFEEVFDNLKKEEIYQLLRDILYEFLIYSNFGLHNAHDALTFNNPDCKRQDNKDIIHISVTKDNQIILSHYQLEKPVT